MTTLLQGRPARGVFGTVVEQRRTVVGYIPIFADGGGWTTQVVLANPNNADFAFGNAEFLGPNGDPIDVTVDGRTASTFDIPIQGGGNILRIFTSGAGAALEWGTSVLLLSVTVPAFMLLPFSVSNAEATPCLQPVCQ
jgi:hypothetical protein